MGLRRVFLLCQGQLAEFFLAPWFHTSWVIEMERNKEEEEVARLSRSIRNKITDLDLGDFGAMRSNSSMYQDKTHT